MSTHDTRPRAPHLVRPARLSAAGLRHVTHISSVRRAVVSRTALISAVAFMMGIAVLIPVFRVDALGAADPGFFATWQNDSESLVLAKIQALVTGANTGADAFGMTQTLPDILAARTSFDSLAAGGVPASSQYGAYVSQLGMQGWLFSAFYFAGARSIGSLWTIETLLFVLVLLGFTLLLAGITRRSVAVVFLLTAVGSPWLTAAARNLYWVPWTWFLPACAAIWFVRSAGRTRRVALAAVVLSFVLRCSMGYEFLTTITLLAAGMPVLALLFGGRGTLRSAIRDSAAVFAAAVAGFSAVLVVQMVLAGHGDVGAGAAFVWHDASMRTYGGDVSNPDVAASMAVSPVQVVAQYFFAWPTDVLSLGSGAPATVVFGPSTVWLLTAAAVGVVLLRLQHGDLLWRRDAFLLAFALVLPVSWFLFAKGHAYIHRTIDFVLWYQLSLALLFWMVGAYLFPLAAQAAAGAVRRLQRSQR